MVDPDVYMTPTPFTQWSLVFEGGDPSPATELRVKLGVAFRAPAEQHAASTVDADSAAKRAGQDSPRVLGAAMAS